MSFASSFSTSEDEPEQTMKLAVSCSLCSKPYKVPKILPRCAHSFCLHCIKEFARCATEIKCPDCQVMNTIGSKGGENLKTNVQLEKIVSVMMETEEDLSSSGPPSPAMSSTAMVDSCAHSDSQMSICSHCEAEFCHVCCVGHKERLKLEIIRLSEKLQQSFSLSNASLAKTLPCVEKAICRNREEVKLEIDEAFQLLVKSLESAAAEEKGKLCGTMDKMIKAKLAELKNAMEKCQKIILPDEIFKRLPHTSVLDMSLDEVATLHGQMSLFDDQISDCEAVKTDVSNTRLHFVHWISNKWLQDLVSNGVLEWKDEPEGKQSNGVFMSKVEPVENEDPILAKVLTEVHAAVSDNNLNFFRAIVKERTLSAASLFKLTLHTTRKGGLTPVQLAVVRGRLEVLIILVKDFHADLFVRTKDTQRTLLHLAAEHGYLDIVVFLAELEPSLCRAVDTDYAETPFHKAVFHGNVDILAYFICRQNISTELANRYGRTVLHMAACNSRSPVLVEFLLAKGANICAMDVYGNQPIHLAVMKGFAAIVSILLRRKPDLVYAVNRNFDTPLSLAAFKKFEDIVALLMNVKNCLENPVQLYWA